MKSLIDSVFISALNLEKQCLQVYEVETGSLLKNFRGMCVAPNSLCILGSSDVICGQKDKPLLQAWNINQNEVMQMRLSLPGRLNVMTVSNSEDNLCAVGVEKNIYIYHMNTGLQFSLISRHFQDVTCLKFSSCGNYLASAGDDGYVYLWSKFTMIESLHKFDVPQIDPHFTLAQHTDKVTGLCFSGLGMRGILVSSSLDGSAKVYDLATGILRYNLIVDSAITCCEVNSVGSHVFLGGQKGKVWVVNLLPHHCSQDIQIEGKGISCHDSPIRHLALTSSGDCLITGSSNGEVKVWSIIMSENMKKYSNPSLALRQTLLTGKGSITNLSVKKIDPEVFQASKIETSSILSPIVRENSENILDAATTFSIQQNDAMFDSREIFNHTLLELFSKKEIVKKTTGSKKKKKTDEKLLEKDNITDTDLLASVQKLKKNNENLIKVCVRHVLGES